jgi:hypothetical protein
MGLGNKTGSVVVAHCYGRAASAGSALSSRATTSTGTTTQSRTSAYDRRPARVLYMDRGVIVLNKPPGLVSQGTSIAAPVTVAAKTTTRLLPARTAFDDVLDGTVIISFNFIGWNVIVSALTRRPPPLDTVPFTIHFRSPTGSWPQYKSVSGPSTRQGTYGTELNQKAPSCPPCIHASHP